jgi:50S ribosomal protein L16 3-hydroxylase
MDMTLATPLLAGLSPQTFMRRHWQKKPLLVRAALPAGTAPLDRATLFALASSEAVESRLVERQGKGWTLRHGPFVRRQLPRLSQPGWTLLVQGADLHLDAAHALLARFRFVPDARLDDLMVSFATDGGGVGPHVDSYDVFLLQVHGKRRWRIGRPSDLQLQPDLPLKILARFEPESEWLLEPGDMLYLPPRWAHDGVAEGECMTCSIGFRSAGRAETAREVLQRLADAQPGASAIDPLYRDPSQAATAHPGAIPAALHQFARDAVARLLREPKALERAVGEWLSEPKPQVWFEAGAARAGHGGVVLDRRTRMLYDGSHVFINGESFRAAGRDATLMHELADRRALDARRVRRLTDAAAQLLWAWAEAGWLHADGKGTA